MQWDQRRVTKSWGQAQTIATSIVESFRSIWYQETVLFHKMQPVVQGYWGPACVLAQRFRKHRRKASPHMLSWFNRCKHQIFWISTTSSTPSYSWETFSEVSAFVMFIRNIHNISMNIYEISLQDCTARAGLNWLQLIKQLEAELSDSCSAVHQKLGNTMQHISSSSCGCITWAPKCEVMRGVNSRGLIPQARFPKIRVRTDAQNQNHNLHESSSMQFGTG